MSLSNLFIQTISLIVGFVYIKSSVGKIKNPYAFYRVIEGYRYIPKGNVSRFLATVMGPLELVIGLLICVNVMRYEALMAGIILQLVFILLMILHLNKVLPFGCGCFGLHAPEKITWKKVLGNVTYLGSLVFLFLLI